MAENFAAKQAEKVLGHNQQSATTQADISNPGLDGQKYAEPSGEKMKALVWMGKNDVRVRMRIQPETPMMLQLIIPA